MHTSRINRLLPGAGNASAAQAEEEPSHGDKEEGVTMSPPMCPHDSRPRCQQATANPRRYPRTPPPHDQSHPAGHKLQRTDCLGRGTAPRTISDARATTLEGPAKAPFARDALHLIQVRQDMVRENLSPVGVPSQVQAYRPLARLDHLRVATETPKGRRTRRPRE